MNILSKPLTDMFHEVATLGTFPRESLSAIITTIPKENKDPTDPSSYRPISLLNTDLKMYAKVIANRLAPLIPQLVHSDQVGFVKGRGTNDATRKVLALLHRIELSRTPSLLVSLDAEKAFDRVNWTYLSRVLGKFGCTGYLYKAIMALYSQPSAMVLSSGFLSSPFNITNGTRQGCPLSPLIFILTLEPLAEKIRNNQLIHGIQVGDAETKLGMYADDILLYLQYPLISLPNLETELNNFSKISYYKLNKNKTVILPCNLDLDTIQSLKKSSPYSWSEKSIKYLGISVTPLISQIYKENYEPWISRLKTKLEALSKLEFSWLGRTAAFKIMVLPQLLYLFRNLPVKVPKKFFTSLQKLLNKFVLMNKSPIEYLHYMHQT
uniref:Reverse transcriptase domain-containing protein n=1 Tax=Xenopus tropicalis TaxID=8364 RepID=A0A803JKZ4_XENTR